MRPLFWTSILMAVLVVSCTTSRTDEVAPTVVVRSTPRAQPVIRCAAAVESSPQTDPCSAKTMAGQRAYR